MIDISVNKAQPVKYSFNKVVPAVVLFIILAAPVFIDPGSLDFQVCYFKSLTGYSCPTCGLSRSFHAVTHFQLKDAFTFHIMGPVLYISFLFFFFKFAYESFSGNKLILWFKMVNRRVLIYSFFGIWMGFWLIRFLKEYSV